MSVPVPVSAGGAPALMVIENENYRAALSTLNADPTLLQLSPLLATRPEVRAKENRFATT